MSLSCTDHILTMEGLGVYNDRGTQKLGVVITDGVGFRNFILTDFIAEAKREYEEVIIFSCLPGFVYDDFELDCKIVELEVFEEKFLTWFFRKFKEVTHLQKNVKDNFGIFDNLQLARTRSKTARGIATRFIYTTSKLFKSEKLIQIYNQLQQFSFHNNEKTKGYKKILEEYRISSLFFTHQRPPFIAPLIYAAKQKKIETAAFIFSWDNLASKGRMAGNFDHYLVWSDLMKEDLLEFYPQVKRKQVKVVGTPQFEPYVLDEFGYEESSLREKFGLKDRPYIFFTCNDSSSENDILYLDCLAGFIEQGKLSKEVDLVVRTSPAEDSFRFRWIKEKYPFIIWNEPDWEVKREHHQELWSQRVPTIEDISDLKSLLKYCTFNINVLSTVTLDAFLFNKEVINPVFGNQKNELFDDQKFLKYRHLSHLVRSEASFIVKNEKEFLDAINFLLTKEDGREFQRNLFLREQIGKPLKNTSKRLVTALKLFEHK